MSEESKEFADRVVKQIDSDLKMMFLAALIGVIFGGFGGFSIGFRLFEDDYRRGQIDALSGEIKFKLVEKDDGSKVWEEIKE